MIKELKSWKRGFFKASRPDGCEKIQLLKLDLVVLKMFFFYVEVSFLGLFGIAFLFFLGFWLRQILVEEL